MDVMDAVRTRLEVREYTEEPVEAATRRAVLEAGRLAPSGKNTQHWHFVLVDGEALEALGDASRTGKWVADADFAVAVLTDPEYDYSDIDAGRAVTHMQLAAWERGVGSCIYTVFDQERTRAVLEAPEDYAVTLVAGFGHPTRPVESFQGRKAREPLGEVASEGTYGTPYGE